MFSVGPSWTPQGASGAPGAAGQPGLVGASGFSGTSGRSGYSGTSGISGFSGFESASDPSAIVSGAGTVLANGVYTPRGTANGKPYYNLLGEPDDPTAKGISWDSGESQWFMGDIVNIDDAFYRSTDDVAFPWLATWLVNAGVGPAPIVTESP